MMDYAENSFDITRTRDSTYMKCRDLRLLQFQKTNFWMRERLTLSTKRVGRRFSDKMEEFWKGKTVYKIKKDYVIPDDVVRSDIDRQAKLFRGNIDEGFQTWFFTFTSCPGLRSLSGKIFREVTLLRKHLLP